MASKKFLRELFQTHLADLKSIYPDSDDVFICPICFVVFRVEDIENGKLTDGHVWPEYLRDKSQLATKQRVLLCHRCNTIAGSRGDKQMQLAERVKDGEESGDLFGERRVELVQNPGENPIELRGSVQKNEDKSITISGNWNRSNPIERERFENLVEQGQIFSHIVHPFHEQKQGLPQVGWITSAYLLAFFVLGYRYVFHKNLTPVREYILQSFDTINEEVYRRLLADDFGVKEYDEIYFPDPEIVLMVPDDGKTKVHLQVNFLQYQVSLPFPFFLAELS